MKSLLKTLALLLVVGGLGFVAYVYGKEYVPLTPQRTFREVEVTEGRIVSVVTSTGTVHPIVTVSVGAFVSGQLKDIHVDFNDEVEKDQLLADIDDRTYKAHCARDRAMLATAKADLKRVEALLQQAKNEEARAKAVEADNPDFISDVELDHVKFQRLSLEAQLEVAQANVQQAEATLQNSTANLENTEIRAPVSGVVIDRRVEPGQTLASQFQVPVLFEIAQDMDREMRITASVDEADIGTILSAFRDERPVRFTVDAYPDELFEGRIIQVRASSKSRESIVTYPVIVSTPNPESKLLPGMTASLEFETNVLEDVMRIPNTALRFLPDAEAVHPEDRGILEELESGGRSPRSLASRSADEPGEAEVATRLVWKREGNFVRPVRVQIGVSNQDFTEVVGGELKDGDMLVDAVLTN